MQVSTFFCEEGSPSLPLCFPPPLRILLKINLLSISQSSTVIILVDAQTVPDVDQWKPLQASSCVLFDNRPPPLVFRYHKILQAQTQLALTLSLWGADSFFVRKDTEKPRLTLSVLSATHYPFQWTETDLLKKIIKSHSNSTLFLKSLLNVHTCISFLFHWKVWFLIILIYLLILPFITNKELTEWN